MRFLTGSLMAAALGALLAFGCLWSGARSEVPALDTVLIGDVPEVVATAKRPVGMMPEVVVFANRMPEVVVRAAPVPATGLLSAVPSSLRVN